tara:strand:- start:1330 stop:2013 length:684 start_codon:yes stop_codon:yes gene_type:complete
MSFLSRFIALVLLIVLSPVIAIISLISLFKDGSPIFFIQERVGYNYKVFNIYKFRTMAIRNNDDLGKKEKDRITKWGSLLRKSKLDELPQLFNILKGDMRFIGPRPEVPEYFERDKFKFLKKLKPGLSDYASILFRNEEIILQNIGGLNPYLKILPLKIILAEYYTNKKSFGEDLFLVLITILAIIIPNYVSKYLIVPIILGDHPELKHDLELINNHKKIKIEKKEI